MDTRCDRHLKKALDLARQLTLLADEGEAASPDDGCIVLYGVVRDCAYRIRSGAQKELEYHQAIRSAGEKAS